MSIFDPAALGRDDDQIDQFVFHDRGGQAAKPDSDDDGGDGGDDDDGDGGSGSDGGPDDWDPDGPYPYRIPDLGLSERSPSREADGEGSPNDFVGIGDTFAFDIFG